MKGRLYQDFVEKDFESFVPEYIRLTDDEKYDDNQVYFQLHGLDQNLLFTYLEPKIQEWQEHHCGGMDDCVLNIREPKYPIPVQYNIGYIRGFNGVQLCDDGCDGPMEEVVRMPAGADRYDDEDEMGSDDDDAGISVMETDVESAPSQVSVDDLSSASTSKSVQVTEDMESESQEDLTPIKTVDEMTLAWVEQVKSDLLYQKTVAGYTVDTAAWRAISTSRVVTKYGKMLPESCLEHFVVGGLLREDIITEQVPDDVVSVYPSMQGVTIEEGLRK